VSPNNVHCQNVCTVIEVSEVNFCTVIGQMLLHLTRIKNFSVFVRSVGTWFIVGRKS